MGFQNFFKAFIDCKCKDWNSYFDSWDCKHPKVVHNKFADNTLEVQCTPEHCPKMAQCIRCEELGDFNIEYDFFTCNASLEYGPNCWTYEDKQNNIINQLIEFRPCKLFKESKTIIC